MTRCTIRTIVLALLSTSAIAHAQTGNGMEVDLDLGTWQLRPYLEIVIGYDTDVFAADDTGEQQDGFASLRVGVEHRKQLGAMYLSGDAYFRVERWRDVSEADDEDIGFDIDIGAADAREFGNRETVAFYFDIMYEDGESLNYETGEVESRQTFGLGAGAGKTIGRLDLDLIYDYSTMRYGDSSRTFAKQTDFDDSRALFDNNSHQVGAQGALTNEEGDLSYLLIGEYGLQNSDGHEDDSNWYALRTGVAYRFSPKTSGNATVGFLNHDDADETTVSYDVGATWEATDKITLGLNGDSTVAPSSTDADTFNTIYTAGGEVRYLVTEKVAARLSVDYRDYTSNQDVVRRTGAITAVVLPAQPLEHDTITTTLSLVWAPPREGYSVFMEAMNEIRSSSIVTNEYDRYLFQTGLIIRY